jgi:hypothetical protein
MVPMLVATFMKMPRWSTSAAAVACAQPQGLAPVT